MPHDGVTLRLIEVTTERNCFEVVLIELLSQAIGIGTRCCKDDHLTVLSIGQNTIKQRFLVI
ncbi:Uncharacterised protein [Vibrio cholerae]|uniref:Uncharacterized protein n=1 Tax=Vibrio cholerae TaxID=666 RepID=A0A655QHW0_VIBCL|nr:Uncharacterised protein [Vibrio cholerae]CSC06370.1 Uncharacterised protein [Vibrio cholerae]CSI55043.1 Uncharacterised protein [Vibrio cholerae]